MNAHRKAYLAICGISVAVTLSAVVFTTVLAQSRSTSIGEQELEQTRQRAGIPKSSSINLSHGLQVAQGEAECTGEGNCLPCFQCHQLEGQGNFNLAYPRLTGQTFRYLYNSLRDFSEGRRSNAIMTPVAKSLTREAMRDVAAFYSVQKAEVPDMAGAAAEKSAAVG